MGVRGAGSCPRGRPRTVAVCLAILLIASACATTPETPPPARSSDVVVLLPDDRGITGSVVVSGAGGRRTLSEPRQAVAVAPAAGPGKPFVLPKDEVRTLVGPALASLPQRPARFIFHFESDDAVLTGKALAKVREAVRAIGKRRPVEISVAGHTDTVGTRRYNYRLGLERARAVAGLLTRAGIDPSLLEIASHGEGNPLVSTGNGVPEPRNRRVELTVR